MTDTQLILEAMRAMEERIMARFPKKRAAPSSAGKKKYGENKRVTLSDAEFAELLEMYGQDRLAHGIKVLDEYIVQAGNKYKSHHFMLKNKWPRERMLEWQPPVERRSLFGE